MGREVNVALVTTIFEIVGMLAAMAALLWLSALVESRQLGPVVVDLVGGEPAGDLSGEPGGLEPSSTLA